MASINKLSVRGVRAFSPDDEEQVISFCFPLTIIVGANGCGKTTIIESLKYAVTGSLPPGNKSGQAFVHDPKSVGSTVVKAAVKLRFTNRAGKSMVVVRSMELAQKKTNMTFKALDGILRTTDEMGNRQSLSHKCTELDRQIPQLLGVSKPILEHVVFCHQEDSSWPLMEGAVLKKRFDDIFDSTRYAKALEAIKQTRKEYQNKVKEHKADLNLLSGHKHAACGFRLELDKAREALSDITDDIREFEDKIEVEKSRLVQIKKILDKKEKIEEDIESKQNEIDREEARIGTQRKALQDDLTKSHSKEQLDDMLRGFDRTMQEDKERMQKSEERIHELKTAISTIQQKHTELTHRKGMLMGEKKNYEKDLRKRIELMEEVSTKYGLDLSFSQTQNTNSTEIETQQSRLSIGTDATGRTSLSQEISLTYTITPEDLGAFQQGVSAKENELRARLIKHQSQSQQEEDEIQGELGDLVAKLKSIENDLVRFQSQREKAMIDLQSIARSSSSSSRMRKSDIDEARRQAEKYAKLRDDLNNNPRRIAIPKEIKDKEEKIEKLKRAIEDDNSNLRELRQCAEEQNAIDILQRQISQDLDTLEEIENENSFLLQKYDISPNITSHLSADELVNITEKMLKQVGEKVEATKFEFEQENENLNSIGKRLSEENALLQHTKQIMDKRKNTLSILTSEGNGVQRIKQIIKAVRSFEQSQGFEETISSDIDPQNLLEHLTTRIGEFSTDEDQPESISRTIKKLRKLSKIKDSSGVVTDIRCPCCKRSMEHNEVEIFNNQMEFLANPRESPIVKMDQSRAQQSRSAVRNFEKWRTTVSLSINDWLDYKRISTEIESMVNSVSEGEDKVKNIQAELDDADVRTGDLKNEHSELQQVHDVARRFRDDALKISDKRTQILSRQDELSMIAPSANGKDLRTLEQEVNAKLEEKDSLNSSISSLNREYSDLNVSISRSSNQAAKAEKLVKDKEEKYSQEQETIIKKQELNEKVTKCKDEEKKLQELVVPIRQKARVKEAEKNKYRASFKAEEEKLNNTLNHFVNDVHRISSISKQIDEYISSNKLQELADVDSRLSETNQEIVQKENAVRSILPDLDLLRKRVNDKEGHQKNVDSNIELLRMLEGLDELEDQLALLEENKMQVKGLKSAYEDYDAVSKSIRAYESEMSRREGSRETFKEQQRELKRKLQTPEYHNIDERHRVKMIESETCIIAVSDLEKYYSALDKALLRFHGMKIEEINKIIQELWTLTYKGEDITSIRLTSDQESGSKASRSYNYRVVMTKGTTELDMRGRCSAGQRVLASIVIRLALAETFCLQCGVMALDEPTTNLDYANKRGLAIALAQIISSRAAQENFQLVIITHDEDFVSMMKTELATHTGFEMPERYFQVSREEGADGSYYSKIHAIDWDEL